MDLNKHNLKANIKFSNNNINSYTNANYNFIEDDNFQSFQNTKGNNAGSIQEFNYHNNNPNQSHSGNSKLSSKNNSPNKKQVGFNNNDNYIHNNNYQLVNNFSPINAKQTKTTFSQNNKANINYNHNLNTISNPNNGNNTNYNNYNPQSEVFNRLYPQSNRNLNNINNTSSHSSNKKVINSVSKAPIPNNRTETVNNKNFNAPDSNQNRDFSTPKINKSKALKYQKDIDYQLYDFIGNKTSLDKKQAGLAKNEIEMNRNNHSNIF